jgi:hypothetical protein
MKQYGENKTVLGATFMFPYVVFAHGEEVIFTFISQIIVLILVITTVAFIKWKLKGKFFLILVYFLSLFITELCVNSIPYFKNKILITVLLLLIPVIMLFISYFKFREKFKKN